MTSFTYASGIAAILAEPDENYHRLMLADVIEEEGNPERAEFVRKSVDFGQSYLVWLLGNPPVNFLAMTLALLPIPHPPLDYGWGTSNPDIWDITRDFWYVLDRGFIRQVRGTMAAWLKHGPELVRLHPVSEVVITDKKPATYTKDGSQRWHIWYKGGNPSTRHRIPDEIFDVMEPDPMTGNVICVVRGDVKMAMSRLSDGCLGWARTDAQTRPI